VFPPQRFAVFSLTFSGVVFLRLVDFDVYLLRDRKAFLPFEFGSLRLPQCTPAPSLYSGSSISHTINGNFVLSGIMRRFNARHFLGCALWLPSRFRNGRPIHLPPPTCSRRFFSVQRDRSFLRPLFSPRDIFFFFFRPLGPRPPRRACGCFFLFLPGRLFSFTLSAFFVSSLLAWRRGIRLLDVAPVAASDFFDTLAGPYTSFFLPRGTSITPSNIC